MQIHISFQYLEMISANHVEPEVKFLILFVLITEANVNLNTIWQTKENPNFQYIKNEIHVLPYY